jgi:hypothetical protein
VDFRVAPDSLYSRKKIVGLFCDVTSSASTCGCAGGREQPNTSVHLLGSCVLLGGRLTSVAP